MEFEWNTVKADSNLVKHGIDFGGALNVFEDPVLLVVTDNRHKEPRFRAIGMVKDELLSVTYTMRDDICRLISARRASRHERRNYHSI
jgi:uncharacterized DUF497 family protein